MKFGRLQKEYQYGQILRQSAVWIVGVLVARSLLDLDQIGQLEWYFFLLFLFSFFWINGFTHLSFRSSNAEWENRVSMDRQYFSLSIIFSSLISFIIFGYAILQFDVGLMLFAALFVSYGPAILLFNHLYLGGDIVALRWSFLLYFSGYLAAVILGVYWLSSVEAIIAHLALLHFFFMMYHAYRVRFNWHSLRKIKVDPAIWWLMAISGVGGLALLVDGLIVKYLENDLELFAVFRYGARELPIAMLVLGTLSQTVIAMFNENPENTFQVFKRQQYRWMVILLPIYVAILSLSDYLFWFLYGERFGESVRLFDTMQLLVLWRLVNPQVVLLAMGFDRLLFRVAIFELIVNVILSVIFYFIIGIWGIVLATVIAFGLEKIILAVCLKEKAGVGIEKYLDIKMFVLFSTIILLVFGLKYLIMTYF